MFGYIMTNTKALSDEERMRLRSIYCGMCRLLKQRYGNLSRFALSYDMTFVALVLMALYEPEELKGREPCLAHPRTPHDYVFTPIMEYAVDMNIALAYHKCADNWVDDKNLLYAGAGLMLKRAYTGVASRHERMCKVIEKWIKDTRAIEQSGKEEIDLPMNLTGEMLGRLFQYREDCWSELLYQMGDSLGRFIYFMDAYEDLADDVRRNRYNPLKAISRQNDYEAFCKDALTVIIADCADAFERLPIVQDAQLIRNILYSGVWSRYARMQEKRLKEKEHK